jgi:hypothetical protein
MHHSTPSQRPAVFRFARGLGNTSGTRRTARLPAPALSGRPRRLSSAGPRRSIEHPSVLNSALTLRARQRGTSQEGRSRTRGRSC